MNYHFFFFILTQLIIAFRYHFDEITCGHSQGTLPEFAQVVDSGHSSPRLGTCTAKAVDAA
jgi:hypothetical protein